jgi:hypothetical protein
MSAPTKTATIIRSVVIDSLRELLEKDPETFYRWREEANSKTGVFALDKRYDESESESDEEDEWMEVYAGPHEFSLICGDDEHLQPYKGFTFYRCWGGGPSGGYIMNDRGKTYRVNRTWGEPFTVERVKGEVEYSERCPMGVPGLRIMMDDIRCDKCHNQTDRDDCYNEGFHTKEVPDTICMKCYTKFYHEDIPRFRSYVLLKGAKVEMRDGTIWLIIRDDENWMANKSILQDDAFDYDKFRKDGIWEFGDHPHYGCFTFNKK